MNELKPWHSYNSYMLFNYQITLLGSLIFCGNKLWALNFIFLLKRDIKLKEFYDPSLAFLISMINITPKINLFMLRLGSAKSKVPLPISEKKQISFAIRWLKSLAKSDNRVIKISKMVDLIMLALYNKGEAVQKKLEVYKIASNNRYLLNRYFK